jgi:hypothetical protein
MTFLFQYVQDLQNDGCFNYDFIYKINHKRCFFNVFIDVCL